MKEGRLSTKKFNEWICVTAQYEKAVARLGKQVYQGFSRGLVTDHTSMELCREISETFSEAKSLRADLEEELERDALDGLNEEEAKKAEEALKLSQAQVTKRRLKLKFTKLLGRQSVNQQLASHRNRVKDLSRDLGLRALACYNDDPILKIRGHRSLCKLAERLCDEADKKWQEITTSNKQGAGGLSFHTILLGFIGDFAKFSKGTQLGKMLMKFFNYDEAEEKQKLTKRFEGSSSANALRAQMEEIDEPHLDVGREIDNMQQEYQEAPEEWSVTEEQAAQEEEYEDEFIQVDEEADDEVWEAGGDTWNPDGEVDEDFLGAVAAAPDLPPEPPVEEFKPAPPPPPPAAGPTLLRNRSQSDNDPWADKSSTPDPASQLPKVGMSPQIGADAPTPKKTTGTSDDWGWGTEESNPNADSWDKPAPSNSDSWDKPAPSKSDSWDKPVPSKSDSWDQPAPPPQPKDWNSSAPAAKTDSWSSPGPDPFAAKPGKRPPFVKAEKKETPLGDWNPEDSFGATKKEPEAQPPADDWGTAAQEPDDWSAPAPPSKPSPSPKADPGEGDPLLRLLDDKPKAQPAPPATPPAPKQAPKDDDLENLGDNLLPAFLRDREEDSTEDDSFIPELPSFLAADDGPELEIVPFGTDSNDSRKKPKTDEDDDIGFIPPMPD